MLPYLDFSSSYLTPVYDIDQTEIASAYIDYLQLFASVQRYQLLPYSYLPQCAVIL